MAAGATPVKHLYFVRHGLSEMNVQGVAAGSSDTPLTPKGETQVEAAGKWARDQGLVFDVILSSPLQRAYHTAQAIATHLDYPHENIIVHPDLRERHFGHLEGRTIHEFDITPKKIVDDVFAFDHIPDIEKITDLQYRANQTFNYLKKLPHESVLVVSHGAFGRALWRTVNNVPIHDFGQQFDNAVIIKLI